MNSISRRDFLKLCSLALGSLAFTPFRPEITEFEDLNLARVAADTLSVYTEPDDESRITGTWPRDELVNIYEEVVSSTPEYNPIWYRVWGGFMHRAHLQRVKVQYNKPLSTIPETGQLAEVSVPYSQALRFTKFNGWQPVYRLYFESVHWIVGIDQGPDGEPWYRLVDELLNVNYNVPAVHLRPIPDEELAPISPDVSFEQKRIEVSIENQSLTAYENDVIIMQVDISSGVRGLRSINNIPTDTPRGEFNIQGKVPSKHMGDGNLAADIYAYELPGVPWTSFFTLKGHAFHGTYWHDNFGVPMSHGCINMRTAEAKWLYRWSRPVAEPDDMARTGFGTVVYIR